MADKRPWAVQLLANIKANLTQLKELKAKCEDEWGEEDGVYRFYHQSFKVYRMQGYTNAILELIKKLKPKQGESGLNDWFLKIVEEGTGHEFRLDHNQKWLEHTRPILEAYFHAKYMLNMIVKYGEELEEPPKLLPSGWASVLYLYNMR